MPENTAPNYTTTRSAHNLNDWKPGPDYETAMGPNNPKRYARLLRNRMTQPLSFNLPAIVASTGQVHTYGIAWGSSRLALEHFENDDIFPLLGRAIPSSTCSIHPHFPGATASLRAMRSF